MNDVRIVKIAFLAATSVIGFQLSLPLGNAFNPNSRYGTSSSGVGPPPCKAVGRCTMNYPYSSSFLKQQDFLNSESRLNHVPRAFFSSFSSIDEPASSESISASSPSKKGKSLSKEHTHKTTFKSQRKNKTTLSSTVLSHQHRITQKLHRITNIMLKLSSILRIPSLSLSSIDAKSSRKRSSLPFILNKLQDQHHKLHRKMNMYTNNINLTSYSTLKKKTALLSMILLSHLLYQQHNYNYDLKNTFDSSLSLKKKYKLKNVKKIKNKRITVTHHETHRSRLSDTSTFEFDRREHREVVQQDGDEFDYDNYDEHVYNDNAFGISSKKVLFETLSEVDQDNYYTFIREQFEQGQVASSKKELDELNRYSETDTTSYDMIEDGYDYDKSII